MAGSITYASNVDTNLKQTSIIGNENRLSIQSPKGNGKILDESQLRMPSF
jgi:hypothetical protein